MGEGRCVTKGIVGYYISAGLIGAGIGALAGAAIDAGRKETEILYSRR